MCIMYIHIYVYIYMCVYVNVCVCLFMCVMYVKVICMCVCIHVRRYTYVWKNAHVCVNICALKCRYVLPTNSKISPAQVLLQSRHAADPLGRSLDAV